MRYSDRKASIKIILQEYGINPKKKLGQNFLLDKNLLRLMVNRCNITSEDIVLEVGSGIGNLTNLLIQRAFKVITVEVDSRLFEVIRTRFAEAQNLICICKDILYKNKITPEVEDIILKLREEFPQKYIRIVSNLPYYILTPLFLALLKSKIPFKDICVLVQKEFFEKLVAKVGTQEYSYLTVLRELFFEIKFVKHIPGHLFYPTTEVDSVIVHMEKKPVQIPEKFVDFVNKIFIYKRKKIKNVLSYLKEYSLPDEYFHKRIQELSPQTLWEVFEKVTKS